MSNASIAGIAMSVPFSTGIALIFGWRASISATAIAGGFIFASALGIFLATALHEEPSISVRSRRWATSEANSKASCGD
jgi:predicted MFS family arabinose efflux permease